MSLNSKLKAESRASEHAALSRYQYLRRVWLAVVIAVMSVFLLFVAPAWQSPITERIIRGIGIVLISVAILGRMWCTLYIGGRKSNVVVITGPYSIMRNPLYFFSAVGAMGVGAISGSMLIALIFGILCVAAFLIVIGREERFLSENFGEPYADYLKKVPRFFPNPRLFLDEPVLSIIPGRVYVTLMDGLVFFAAIPAFALVKYLQDSGFVPVLLRLY